MQVWTHEDLRAWRTRMGWTQAEAAERLGIGLRTYTDRENGGKVSVECMLACQMLEQLHGGPALLSSQPAQIKAAAVILAATIVKALNEIQPGFPREFLVQLEQAYAKNRDAMGQDFLETLSWTREMVKLGDLQIPDPATSPR